MRYQSQDGVSTRPRRAFLRSPSTRFTNGQFGAASLHDMSYPAIVGFGVGLVVAGGSALALTQLDHHSSATTTASTPSATVRPASNPDPARTVYSDTKNSVV